MSLTAQVTKKSVTGNQPRINTIIFTLVLTDTAGAGFTQDYSCEYRQGDNVASKVAEIVEKMQISINSYKAQQLIFSSTALNNAVTSIAGSLTL